MNIVYTSLNTRLGDRCVAAATARASLGALFIQAGHRVWKALEASGRARAQRRLVDFADQCEALQPELAKELRAASRELPMT